MWVFGAENFTLHNVKPPKINTFVLSKNNVQIKRVMYKNIIPIVLLLVSFISAKAQLATPDQSVVYKKSSQRERQLHIFYPKEHNDDRPVIISFFGGGWKGGNPNQFYDQSEYYATLGVVGISVDYRTSDKDQTTPFEAVMDAKSAVRWVRENHEMLGIDPQKIIVSGGSAGGHLASCTAVIEGVEDDADLTVSSKPNAMILFNPVVNTTAQGYGSEKLKGRETELSPVHHIDPQTPPTLILHGTKDTTVPYQNAVDFAAKMKAQGNLCQLISFEGENHGFFNSPNFNKNCSTKNYIFCLCEITRFLAEQGYISPNQIPQKD